MNDKYLRMIRRMDDGGEKDWNVYVLRCGDGSLYTGVAKDVDARIKKHSAGKGAAYTRSHLPVELVWREAGFTRSGALLREAQVKSWPRPKKEMLVNGVLKKKPAGSKKVKRVVEKKV